ncbi:MAG: hypothetical protein ACRDGB_10645, partial [Candidatus Limnocylindria bacterium]
MVAGPIRRNPSLSQIECDPLRGSARAHDCSIFLSGNELFGYLEVADFEHVRAHNGGQPGERTV